MIKFYFSNLLFIVSFVSLAQMNSEVRFEQITTRQGLSNNQINSIFQDDQGFIWIGTLSGLNRYDGYEMETFYHLPEDSTSLFNNTVIEISQGPDDQMWVKHSMGISTYDPSSGEFSYPAYFMELLQTSPVFILEMARDSQGNSWFVIENRGVVKITPDHRVVQLNASREADVRLASNQVTGLYPDEQGGLWIVHASGTFELLDINSERVIKKYGLPAHIARESYWSIFIDSDADAWLYSEDDPFGLFYLNTTTGQSKVIGQKTLSSDLITGLLEPTTHELWIGADHGGVSILDKTTWKIKSVKNDPDQPKSLLNNNIKVLFKDREDGVWVGTTKSGISYHHPGATHFEHVKIDRRDPAYNDVSSFAEDINGRIWIGTNGKGLLSYDRSSGDFTSILGDPSFKGSIPEIVVSLCYDSRGYLWVGSYLEGLFRLDLKRKHSERVLFSGNKSDVGSSVWELMEDSNGNIWIGTLSRGAYMYNPDTKKIKNYNKENSLGTNYVTCMTEDLKGRIWLGTGVGLTVVDQQKNEILSYRASDSSDYPLSSNSVFSLLRDSAGNIWAGTLDGLNRFDSTVDGFKVLRQSEGLSSNIIMAILEGEEGDIWVSTSHGLNKLTGDAERASYICQVFGPSDGLQAENFTEDAALKTRDGALVFGGQNGFNVFRSEEIVSGDRNLKVVLAGLSLNSLHVYPGDEINGRILLAHSLDQTKELSLGHDENSFTIDFVALSYFQSSKIRYQYRMEGLSSGNSWVSVSPDVRQASFNGLATGDYVLRIRASASPSTWPDDEVVLRIHINPPFWQTPWAYLLYVMAVFALVYVTRTYVVYRERQKASVENERKENERRHQLDLMKIKFFTNVSHEFRTPLSLVLTPIERMIQHPDFIKVDELKLVQRNAKRLMNLVNQLLDFRKMEANQHTLSQSSGDLVDFLKDINDSFSDLSREKSIELSLVAEVASYYTFFDKDKMEKVMLNLLSNAFKFTHAGGKIQVDFDVVRKEGSGQGVVIMVTDTGIGIPEDKHELIFNRFFQNEISGDIVNNGTGIGLSITREFVELHGGHIHVDSKADMGSTFVAELPLKQITNDQDVAEELVKELQATVNHFEEEEEIDASLPTVLLVEDNFDFRFYLKDNLKQYFNVEVAANGKEAWKHMISHLPDIVISDVMMPVMDGYALCEKIKSDPRTLQIPVILLTAQSSDQHRIKGLDAGAIEYISKPFNFEILLSSIRSALKFQKRVQESGNKIKVHPSQVDIVSEDEKLIQKGVQLVESNMSNSDFSVEDLSHELGYSRGHFYQKILKITGQTPIDFIRNIRMKRAAELLKKSQLNVSEVAYKVGYNNPKLFSRYFKSQYKVYPSEYRVTSGEASDS